MSCNKPPLTLIYRGSLTSCQYSCHYCPFALREDSRQKLAQDAAELQRFVDWVGQQNQPIRVFFTPWGEALIRKHYQQAIIQLSQMGHVVSVAIQTNLHFKSEWLTQVQAHKVVLWCTFHPTQTSLADFLSRCAQLDRYAIRYSVGMVALQEHLPLIQQMRQHLPASVYFWLNAYDKRGKDYYSAADEQILQAIDPWFSWNLHPRKSRNAPCWAGERSIRVDGKGQVIRCHFIRTHLGNIYTDALANILQERPCTKNSCVCFIGYSQRKDLPFQEDFGLHLLARLPESFSYP